jgi:hypothetical protein
MLPSCRCEFNNPSGRVEQTSLLYSLLRRESTPGCFVVLALARKNHRRAGAVDHLLGAAIGA